MACRPTPSETLNGKSPAQIFLGRKMRTRIDLLKPEPKPQPVHNERKVRMTDQFNSHHGPRAHHFAKGDLVWSKNLRPQPGTDQWLEGQVLRRRGRTVYEISVLGTDRSERSTSTSSEADPLFLFQFQMPLSRSEVLHPVHLVHRLTQLPTLHARRLHAQLLHLHDERLHSELLLPGHRLHVSRSHLRLDDTLSATVTPPSTTAIVTTASSSTTDPGIPGPGILLFDVPSYGISRYCSFCVCLMLVRLFSLNSLFSSICPLFRCHSPFSVRREFSYRCPSLRFSTPAKSSLTLFDAFDHANSLHGSPRRLQHSTCSALCKLCRPRATRSSSYAVDALHALRATSTFDSVYPVHLSILSRCATLTDFTSPPDVRLRS